MVNLVIVSHSEQLALGVRELAQQMAQEKVQIAVAAGIDDPEQPIGTDAIKVLEAINSVLSDDGVLVLMDLGSALLSAETALEFLEPDDASRVRLCPAPLVEGTLAAAVQASVGADLDTVFQEAMGALQAKQQQMPGLLPEGAAQAPAQMLTGEELTLTIRNRLGLHARPAARLVSTAGNFDAAIEVRLGAKQANAKSINQIATLGARQGDEIVVTASGPDAGAALAAIKALADEKFGDKEGPEDAAPAAAAAPLPAPESPAPGAASASLNGIGASSGIAIGPLVQYRPTLPHIEVEASADPQREWQELEAAVDASLAEIETLRRQMVQSGNEAEADIFTAHELILRDPDFLAQVQQAIMQRAIAAPGAWQEAVQALAAGYSAIEDAYMRARANDVQDVGRRVLGHLLQLEPPALDFETPSIIAARDLAPSDTARFDPQKVRGVVTELGGATSHSAILARALGIPAVVGVGPALAAITEGTELAIDGDSGAIWLQPDDATLDELRRRQRRFRERQEQARRSAQEAATTADGRRIEVAANIGGPQDIALALELGAEGVGLFRTEFLFLDRDAAPSEEEQFAAYRQVAEALGPKPLIIRTLDVGGDKPLPYFDLGTEANPFLGWRGIRFCLDNPDIFLPQLRAILRAGAGQNVKLMFPMIGAISELQAAKAMLQQAKEQLRSEATPFDDAMELGIMVEVPAAVSIADQLAQEVDFFSLGTNDLTQYVMAADRGNRRVSDLADALHPAVLREVARTVEAGHEAGIWVGMCGELAGDPLASELLVGLGLDELSMNAPAIPLVKETIRSLDSAAAQRRAQEILQLTGSDAVKERLRSLAPNSPASG